MEWYERPGYFRYTALDEGRHQNSRWRDELRRQLTDNRAEQARLEHEAEHGDDAEERSLARRDAEQVAEHGRALQERIDALWRSSAELEAEQNRIADTWSDQTAEQGHDDDQVRLDGRAEQDGRQVDDDGDGDGS